MSREVLGEEIDAALRTPPTRRYPFDEGVVVFKRQRAKGHGALQAWQRVKADAGRRVIECVLRGIEPPPVLR